MEISDIYPSSHMSEAFCITGEYYLDNITLPKVLKKINKTKKLEFHLVNQGIEIVQHTETKGFKKGQHFPIGMIVPGEKLGQSSYYLCLLEFEPVIEEYKKEVKLEELLQKYIH